jgi:hypothetical protein
MFVLPADAVSSATAYALPGLAVLAGGKFPPFVPATVPGWGWAGAESPPMAPNKGLGAEPAAGCIGVPVPGPCPSETGLTWAGDRAGR